MLGGAYSSQYRTIERQQVESIKSIVEHGKNDAIARARKLSIETNKRRRALAVKRKTEAEKEEKRRQHILAKRREKQNEATEKFQRAHISSRPSSGNSGKWSPRYLNTTRLEDALRIVRGSPRTSSARAPGQTSPTHTYYRQNSDPVNKPYFNKYAHPNTTATNGSLRDRQAELHNKSLRNLTNSRSLFEQQLESHQQQLVDQQQKALRDFNQQLLSELGDETVNGAADNNKHLNLERSDTSSLSSVDSLDETTSNDTLRESVDLDSFIALKCGTSDTTLETNGASNNTIKNNSINKTLNLVEAVQADNALTNISSGQGQYDSGSRSVTSNSGSRMVYNGTENRHRTVVNDAYNAQHKAELTAQRIEEEKQKYYQQRQVEIQKQLEQQQQQKLLIQQHQGMQQKVLEQQQKQQAVLQQHFQRQQQEQLERQRQQQEQLQLQQHKHQEYMKEQSKTQTDNASVQDKENLRPKAHMKAWATPSPHPPVSTPSVTNTPQNFVTHASPYTGKSTHTNVTVTTYDVSVANQSAAINTATTVLAKVTDQKLVDSLPPQPVMTHSKSLKQETNTTLVSAQNGSWATNTGVDKNLSFLQTVTNNLDQEQNSSTLNTNNKTVLSKTSEKTVQYQTAAVSGTAKTNVEKSVSETKVASSSKTVPSSPKIPSYQSYYMNSYAERYNANKTPIATETAAPPPERYNANKTPISTETAAPQPDYNVANGSIMKGTVGFVDGQLSMLPNDQMMDDIVDTADTDSVSTLCDDKETEVEEVKGILKRPNKSKGNSGILKKSGSTGNMKQAGIRDSLEITRVHLQTSAEDKHQRMLREQERKLNPPPTPSKKNVRFADLCYEEQDNQGEEETEDDKLFVRRNKAENVTHKPPRPVSASAAKTGVQQDPKNKQPRVHSATTIRTSSIPRTKTQIVRPQAAAHIITQNLNDQNSNSISHDKKVTIVNNDFMEKVPSMARAQNSQVVHTVTPTSVYAVTSVSYSRPVEQKVNYAVSSVVMPKSDSQTVQTAPFIYPNYNTKGAPPPTSSSGNPNQALMNGANFDGAVYDENGIRIDRTPTDDEINFLWDKVRTCLSRNSQATPDKLNTPTSVGPEHQQSLARQAAPMHQKYIDGNALGQFNSLNRVASQPQVYSTNLRRHNSMDNVNGYSKRYGLLQRKQQPNPNSLKSRQQQAYTVYQAPVPSQQEPQNTGIQPAPDVSESMAGFLAAEQLVDQSVSDSRIQQAIDEAQNRQGARQPKAKSALSMEEQRLLESLDRLNDKLKVTEATIPNGSGGTQHPQQKLVQQYTHISSFTNPDGKEEEITAAENAVDKVGGFKGHAPIISPQRRVIETANQKARLRITSAHLKRNLQH